MSLERAHRVGQRSGQRPRPIIALFSRFCGSEMVMRIPGELVSESGVVERGVRQWGGVWAGTLLPLLLHRLRLLLLLISIYGLYLKALNVVACVTEQTRLAWVGWQCMTLGACLTDHCQWSTLAANRQVWRHMTHQAVYAFEDSRRASLKNKRQRRKNQETPAPSLDQNFTCSRCGRTCLSRIGLVSHVHACSRRGPLP
ncbi:hypothetical protein Pcinc_011221 [Petrolisthes cinctipes]|uniref:Uncharacterized protein n=1 Tax=Petrolisthes cinctipes TaxID=88211 RepID=A0AAE1G1D8_PETCI|nr:hypothetical protein Pcinc_011221 [Petrolisthes cinctipes]